MYMLYAWIFGNSLHDMYGITSVHVHVHCIVNSPCFANQSMRYANMYMYMYISSYTEVTLCKYMYMYCMCVSVDTEELVSFASNLLCLEIGEGLFFSGE